ncbi:hypothetical protein O7621_28225 [Solwaraspora sp. WMMD937]|nr:hypothetical protein [Solwaraspora sp. WMMD937]WFE21660.1 hypothetical protein O7621_28225 [Solwaraspora sp. WMMD937]
MPTKPTRRGTPPRAADSRSAADAADAAVRVALMIEDSRQAIGYPVS